MREKKTGKVEGGWWTKENGGSLEVMKEGVNWYEMYKTSKGSKEEPVKVPYHIVQEIHIKVEEVMKRQVEQYHKLKKKRASTVDEKWMEDVIKSGTLSDKVAALALKVQASPLHELETLDLLVTMANKKEQRTSQLALEALKDLWIHNLLPDRKLVAFKSQNLLSAKMDMATAQLMWFEDQLISRYGRTIDALDIGLKSTVDFFKKFSMGVCLDLISGKPEQEQRLLGMLINKLGDAVGGACSRASQLLKTLVQNHGAMKGVVVREVRQFIHRPNLNPKSLYNAVIFLNQLTLTYHDTQVAEALIETFVGLFEKAVASKEMSSKLLAGLLNGINKAYPFLKDPSLLQAHVDALFRIVHVATFSAATQALLLISLMALAENKATNKVAKGTEILGEGPSQADGISRRYYRALYEKLLAEQVLTRAHNTVFLNLLFRSVKSDKSELRAAAFIKRICMCVCQAPSPIAAGLLFLVSEIVSSRPSLHPLVSSAPHSVDKNTEKPEKKDEDEKNNDEQEESFWTLNNYDAAKREPEFACATMPSLWELCLLRHHFHPSVAAFTSSMLTAPHTIKFDGVVLYLPSTFSITRGDPTVEFSLASFLNRFSYKNAKAGKTKALKSRVINEEAINSSEFTALPSSAVAPDKAFFHRFFGSRAGLIEKGLVSKSVRRKSKSEDADDEDGDLGEEGIDRFADKLAEDLMASSGAGDPDVDDDDFEGLGSGDDDDGDDGGLEFDADDGERMDDEDVDGEGDYDQLVAYGDEVEMVNEESDQNESSRSMVSKGARKRHLNIPKAESKDKKKKKSESGFADAAEYEDIMEQIVQYHAANKASTGETSDGGGERMRKKSKSKIGRRNEAARF